MSGWIKKEDYYLFVNKLGSYHLSISKFEELGEEEATRFAISEIEKKQGEFKDRTINFDKARRIGFCEYGIKDFCEKMNLDIKQEYDISYLRENLTIEALIKYPEECFKLFGKSVLDKFGGVVGLLEKNQSRDALSLVLENSFLKDRTLYLLATDFAFDCLPIYEREYPDDDRPRKAIEGRLKWLNGEIDDNELRNLNVDADLAAYNAIGFRACCAGDAADASANGNYRPGDAADYAAAYAADATGDAANARKRQAKMIIKRYLEKENE